MWEYRSNETGRKWIKEFLDPVFAELYNPKGANALFIFHSFTHSFIHSSIFAIFFYFVEHRLHSTLKASQVSRGSPRSHDILWNHLSWMVNILHTSVLLVAMRSKDLLSTFWTPGTACTWRWDLVAVHCCDSIFFLVCWQHPITSAVWDRDKFFVKEGIVPVKIYLLLLWVLVNPAMHFNVISFEKIWGTQGAGSANTPTLLGMPTRHHTPEFLGSKCYFPSEKQSEVPTSMWAHVTDGQEKYRLSVERHAVPERVERLTH